MHIALLDINAEGKLHREIRDIIEEIDIMLYITRSQKDVLKSYVSQVEEIIDPLGKYQPRSTTRSWDKDRAVTEYTSDMTQQSSFSSRTEPVTTFPEKVMNGNIYDAFMKRAADMTAKVGGHIEELDQLRVSAQITAESVSHPQIAKRRFITSNKPLD